MTIEAELDSGHQPDTLVKPVKSLRKLLSKLDNDPAPEEVHGLRTSGRRFEAAFGDLALDDEGIPKSVLNELTRLRKRAGKLRYMDVLTEFAATVRLKGEEERHVRLLEHLARPPDGLPSCYRRSSSP
jgi:CHAD domain-containing protein